MSTFLVTGSDLSLVSRALSELLDELSSAEMADVELYEPAESREAEAKGRVELGPIVSALSTPSFMSERRVVVVRDASSLDAAQSKELAALVSDPPTENHLVLVSGGTAIPAVLVKAAQQAGAQVIETDPGRQSRARQGWFDTHVRRAPVSLDPAARRRLAEHIGEDARLLDPLLEILAATYGEDHAVSTAELEPLLGEAGAAPPWDLTDAIDSGDGERAIEVLHRMLGAGERHPLQVLAIVHRHVSAMLRLDGASEVRTPDDAARVLSMSAYPARKVLEQSRRLGHERIVRALEVVAGADADLRGRVAWPSELVMEVAVARLAQLSRQNARAVARQRGRPGTRSPARPRGDT